MNSHSNINQILALCIPTYNRSIELENCIKSLIPIIKSYNIPIYISDNNSPDNTREIIEKIKKEYDLIFFTSNKENIGPEANTENVLNMPSTKYRWLLGDHYTICDQESFLNIYEKLTKNEEYDFLIVNSENRIKHIPEKTYTDKDSLIVEIGWHMTMLSTLIYNGKTLPKLNFTRFHGTCFSQTLSILEYCSAEPFKGHWIRKNTIKSIPTRISTTWLGNATQIFIFNWYYGILSLSPQYNIYSKIECIQQHSFKSGLFSPRNILLIRSQGGVKLNQVLRNLQVSILTIGTARYSLLLIISLIPISTINLMLNTGRRIKNIFC